MQIDIDTDAKELLMAAKQEIKNTGRSSATYSDAIRYLAGKRV